MKKQISLYLMVLLIFFTLCAAVTADVLPPALEIEEVSFSEILYAGQTRTLSIKIKNTGLGNAHDVTVELSSNLQGLSFPAMTPVPTIPKGSTQAVDIPVSGKKDLANEDEARITIRLIDKGHNQEFPFNKPWKRTFKTREIELVLDQVKFNNVNRPNKPIQQNDVINLKFRVYNKSGVKAEKVTVKVENKQKGVKWLGAKIGEPLGDLKDLPQERPVLGPLNPKAYKVAHYVYHLDRDFKAREVQFTLSGTVGAEKDQWMKEKYKTSVIIPSNWFRSFGWVVVGILITVIIIFWFSIRISSNWFRSFGWVVVGILITVIIIFWFSIRIPFNWPHLFGWVAGAVIIAIIIRWVSNFFSERTNSVYSVVYSPDGKTLASGAWDRTVKLWDVRTGGNIATFEHGSRVDSVVYSPDGKTLASGAWDGTVKLWDVDARRNIATFEHGSSVYSRVHSVVYSPDGKTLASGAWDGTVKLWDVRTGGNIATFEHGSRVDSRVYSVVYSPDGKTLASGAWDRTVKLWDVDARRNIATFEHGSSVYPRVHSVVYSPDGKTLASGAEDGTVKLWDVRTGGNIATFEHGSSVYSVVYSPDGKTLASGAEDGTVKLWDVDARRNIATFKGHRSGVHSVVYSPDGKTLASGAEDGTVKLWDVKTKRNIATY